MPERISRHKMLKGLPAILELQAYRFLEQRGDQRKFPQGIRSNSKVGMPLLWGLIYYLYAPYVFRTSASTGLAIKQVDHFKAFNKTSNEIDEILKREGSLDADSDRLRELFREQKEAVRDLKSGFAGLISEPCIQLIFRRKNKQAAQETLEIGYDTICAVIDRDHQYFQDVVDFLGGQVSYHPELIRCLTSAPTTSHDDYLEAGYALQHPEWNKDFHIDSLKEQVGELPTVIQLGSESPHDFQKSFEAAASRMRKGSHGGKLWERNLLQALLAMGIHEKAVTAVLNQGVGPVLGEKLAAFEETIAALIREMEEAQQRNDKHDPSGRRKEIKQLREDRAKYSNKLAAHKKLARTLEDYREFTRARLEKAESAGGQDGVVDASNRDIWAKNCPNAKKEMLELAEDRLLWMIALQEQGFIELDVDKNTLSKVCGILKKDQDARLAGQSSLGIELITVHQSSRATLPASDMLF